MSLAHMGPRVCRAPFLIFLKKYVQQISKFSIIGSNESKSV